MGKFIHVAPLMVVYPQVFPPKNPPSRVPLQVTLANFESKANLLAENATVHTLDATRLS
jgi:hypothetical protein